MMHFFWEMHSLGWKVSKSVFEFQVSSLVPDFQSLDKPTRSRPWAPPQGATVPSGTSYNAVLGGVGGALLHHF